MASKYIDYVEESIDESFNEQTAPVQKKLNFDNSCGLSSVEINYPMTQALPELSDDNSFLKRRNLLANSDSEGELYTPGKKLDFHTQPAVPGYYQGSEDIS